ncbi:MAG: YebC/PmpR family DNA-binding transcriptional regulator [Clostridia bacterium]|nr:YebC/PmpR family DNA-binding transcriptional regulator [Clostridia bacterium]
MSGHSKWKNIMHKKEKTDAQRAKVFTKIGKEMAIAIRDGGPDPVSNGKLADLIAKAKSLNVPNDNIKRVIEKYSGNNVANYDEITYEGYGPSGVALIVTTATDNKNRTAGNVRHYFDKFGGNLGATGCVSYMFTDAGVIVVDAASVKDEDKLMEDALEAGAADFSAEDGAYEVTTEVSDLKAVREALEGMGYVILSAEEDKVPSTYVDLDDEDAIKNMNRLLDALDDDDDVTNVYHNWSNCD